MNKNLNAGITMLLVGVGKFMQDARLMVREELVEFVGLVLWCVVGTKSPDVGLGSCADEEVAKDPWGFILGLVGEQGAESFVREGKDAHVARASQGDTVPHVYQVEVNDASIRTWRLWREMGVSDVGLPTIITRSSARVGKSWHANTTPGKGMELAVG